MLQAPAEAVQSDPPPGLESALRDARRGSGAPLARWVAAHGEQRVFDPQAQHAPHPAYRAFHQMAGTVDWDAVLDDLPPRVSFEILRRQNQHSRQLGAADYVPPSALYRPPVLRFLLGYLRDHAGEARYDGARHRIRYPDPRLEDCVTAIWTFARTHPEAFRRVRDELASSHQLDSLLRATNTEDPRSRVEPADHLALHLERDLVQWLERIQARPLWSQTLLSRFSLQVTRTWFGAPATPPEFPSLVWGRNSDPYSRRFEFLAASAGPLSFEEEAAGEWIRLRTLREQPTVNSATVCRLRWISNPDLRVCHGVVGFCQNRRFQQVSLRLRMPEEHHMTHFEVEAGAGRLPWTEAIRLDRARESGVLVAIATIAIGGSLSEESLEIALDVARGFGYRLAAPPEPIPHLRSDFLRRAALPDTACLIPVYHMVDQDTYPVGWNHARLVTLERSIEPQTSAGGIHTLRLLVYAPPASPNNEAVILDRDHFSGLFAQRLAVAPPPDTLTVLNLSCDSQYTVESWMAAFREAVRAGDPSRILAADVPLIIGTHRGFEETTRVLWLAYPTTTLQSLLEGKSRTQIVQALQASRFGPFDPTTNLARPALYDLGGHLRIRVTSSSHPARSVTY